MKNKHCSVCLRAVENEDAPILTMSGAGVARCLCDSCAADLELATTAADYDEITAAMDRLTAKLSESNIDDPITVDTISSVLESAAKRAVEIKSGTYDFSLDEMEADGFDEIPEELLESEEDKLLDEQEAKQAEKLDRILNWVWAIVLIGIAAFLVWWLFF